MADINSRLEIGVTTGPIRGSRKIHVGPHRVAMREIALEPSSGEPPLRVYDTSGPYSDPDVTIDIGAGLAPMRREWIMARGDVEEYDARAVKPEDNGLSGPDRSGGVPQFPNVVKRPLRATLRRCVPMGPHSSTALRGSVNAASNQSAVSVVLAKVPGKISV